MAFILPDLLIATATMVLVQTIVKLLPDQAVRQLLFDGEIDGTNKTKYFFTQITDRYKESIKGLNGSIAFNIGFALFALYAYFALPSSGTITIPFVSLPVSRLVWVSLVPLISFGLQTLIITSFVWYMILRLGIKMLNEEVGVNQEFGDATNILLNGTLGHVWIILRLRQYIKSRLNYIWYIPALLLFLIIVASPLLLCIYFIIQLFRVSNIILGLIYSFIFIPYSALFLLLIIIASILGTRFTFQAKRSAKVSSQDIQRLQEILK